MKTTLLLIALAATSTFSAQAAVIETTKGSRFTTEGSAIYQLADSKANRGNCPMMQQRPVVRVYNVDAKGRATITRASSENGCSIVHKKKTGSKETESAMACNLPSGQQACTAMSVQ